MKRLSVFLIVILAVALIAGECFAAWTITPSVAERNKNYSKIKFLLTADAATLAATDLLAVSAMTSEIRRILQGSTAMLMKVSPGTGSVIPDDTINLILSDDEGDALFTKTTISKDAISWHLLSTDISSYPPILRRLYLTMTFNGGATTAADQVTLYIIVWNEGEEK